MWRSLVGALDWGRGPEVRILLRPARQTKVCFRVLSLRYRSAEGWRLALQILVGNDDGISRQELHALVAAVAPLGEVWVVAPASG